MNADGRSDGAPESDVQGDPMPTSLLVRHLLLLRELVVCESDDSEARELAVEMKDVGLRAGMFELRRRAAAGDDKAKLALQETTSGAIN